MTKVGITPHPPQSGASGTHEFVSPPANATRPGSVLADKYRIERTLGQGGMGVVVAAWHLQLERTVAIKLIRPEWAHDPSAVQRMLREAKALASLNSEHAARVIDVGTSEAGLPFIVMEYLEGSDLETVLHRDGPLGTEEAVDFLLQACEAIAEAHRNHIVHRDLKPANLFVTKQPGGVSSIKVVDFGISKLINARAMDTLTRPAGIVGSLHHMAPEQMRAGAVDARTDVWALGAVLFEMLTGLKPFPETAWAALCSDLLPAPLPLLDALPETVPEEVFNSLRRCLNRAPDDRYANVAELAVVLSPFGSRSARTSLERIVRLATSTGSLAANAFWSPPSPSPGPVAPIGAVGAEATASKAEAEHGAVVGEEAPAALGVSEPAGERVAVAKPADDTVVPVSDPSSDDADLDAEAIPAETPEELVAIREVRRRRQIREIVGAALAGFLLLVVLPVLCVSQTYELRDPSRRNPDPSEGAAVPSAAAAPAEPATLAPAVVAPPSPATPVPAAAAAPGAAAKPSALSRATGALQPTAMTSASASPTEPPAASATGPRVAPVLPSAPRTPVVAPIPAKEVAVAPATAAPKPAAPTAHGNFDIIRKLPADMAAPKPAEAARRDGTEQHPAPPRSAPSGEAPAPESPAAPPKRGISPWNLKDLEFE